MKFTLSVNVALPGLPIEERIRIAAEAGYDGVDIYGILDGYDLGKAYEASQKYEIPLIACSADRAFETTLNKRWNVIEPAIKKTISCAKQLGMKRIAMLGGFKTSDFDDPKLLLLENTKRLAELGEKEDIIFMIEPINNVIEHQTAYLHSSAAGAEIVNAVYSDHIKLLFDFVHLETAEGNVLNNALAYKDIIDMFHVVGIPKHDEPFNSQLDYPYILSILAENGYDGYVGAEYEPSYDPETSVRDVLNYLKMYKTRKDCYRSVQ